MRKLIFLAIILCVFGCGSEGSSGESINPTDLSDLEGSYNLRNDNCDTLIQKFNIIQSSTSITLAVVDPGTDSSLTEGDLFRCELDSSAGNPAARCDSLGCSGRLIEDEEDATNIFDLVGVNGQVGDMLMVCYDDSADGACELSYQRSE